MSRMRIYLAHEDADCRQTIESCMQNLGHLVLLSTACCNQLMSTSIGSPPDIAIVSCTSNVSANLAVVNRLSSRKTCPLIAVVGIAEFPLCQQLVTDDVSGVLIDISTAHAWRPALYLAKLRFEQSQRMEAKLKRLQAAVGRLKESN